MKKKVMRGKRSAKKNTLAIWVVVLVLVVAAIFLYWYFAGRNTIKAKFTCSSGKTITAVFHTGANGYVDITMSGKKKVQLPVTASAGGARYANSDESIVFWNTGNTASVEESGKTTYKDCIQQ